MKFKSIKKVIQIFLNIVVILSFLAPTPVIQLKNAEDNTSKNGKVMATNQYTATGGLLETGTETAVGSNNLASWRGTLGDDNNYWQVARNNPGGLSQLLYFDGVQEYGANKMIIYIYDSNVTTGNAYEHQICDWTSSTSVDYAADSNCTGGGWRMLSPRKTTENATAETNYSYEIYNGYFWSRSSSPGTVVSTPLSNFIRSSDDRVLIRTYSTVASTVNYRMDFAQIEMAIDSVYEPADFVNTSGGATTGYVSDVIGVPQEGGIGYGSDGNRFQISQPGSSQAVDMYYVFKNIKTYTGMNTILVSPEICVSNTALTFGIYARNFNNSTWTQIGTTITGSACTTDTVYLSSFNSTAIGGFSFADHISNTDEVWIRILTNSPAATYNIRLDAIYVTLGSVNTDSAKCGISWGTGTSTDCVNTRDLINDSAAAVTTANTSTWQNTSEIEYPSGHFAGDNDDDATNSEYAYSYNLSMPITVSGNMSVTGIHYSVRFRSNVSTITLDTQIKNFAGDFGIGGESAGTGWTNTASVDTNNSTNYSYYDSALNRELLNSPENHLDTTNNLGNIRLSTSASTNTTGGTTADWDFAMMSIRWLEETNRVTMQTQYAPTDGVLVNGTNQALSNANVGTWKGLRGNDGNYWQIARNGASSLEFVLNFDGVQLREANKIIITLEQSNTTTANAYSHQICDWVSSTSVDYAADANCTGGGWRTLTPDKATLSPTADTMHQYEIYDGYFDTRAATPGAPISTPLSNFIDSTNNRVSIRTYSTVNSTVVHKTDFARVEVAIDPVYEPAEFVKTAGGTTTGFISDLTGAASTGINGSDNVDLGIPNSAANTPMDFYFVFKNVKKYTGANTILFVPEIAVNNVGLTFEMYVRDFSSGGSWKQAGGTVTATSTADWEYGTAFNSTTTTGFDINNSISSTGEVWIRILTNGPATARTMTIDRMYMILGSVNTDSAQCEISWGTGTATNCLNTRDLTNDVVSGTPTTANTSTWQTTTVIEYPSGSHELDNDDDGTNSEYAISQNMSFPITIGSGEAVTGVHYAGRYRSNVTTITRDLQFKTTAGGPGYGGISSGQGWINTPGGDSNALTTYGYYDSWRLQEQTNNPQVAIDTTNNIGNLRLRTSASTNVAGGVTSDWDFAMMSIRFIRDSSPIVSISVSDGTVSYGSVAKGGSKTTIDLSDTQTITNDSNVSVNFNIKGQNTACPWTLSGTAGTDTYEHQFCKKSDVACTTPPTDYTDLTTSYQTLYSSVAVSATRQVDLRIVLPTDTACTSSQSADITLQAVQP